MIQRSIMNNAIRCARCIHRGNLAAAQVGRAANVPRHVATVGMLGARGLKTSSTSHKNPSFERPGPPPLPAKEQREFEKLIKEKQNLSPFSSNASMDAEELHPDMRRKPDPDFDGETNPMTGEVGGPKKDPLAWQREWTYGGRATDF